MSDDLLYTKDGAIATIRFNRPEKKNALTVAMYAAMVEALDDARNDDVVRAVAILGGDVFTAGNDIGDFIAAGGISEDLPVVRFLQEISTFSKPLIAGVKGVAIGLGTTLLMHCDAVVAGTSARFMLPFTKLGLVPEAGSSVLFPLIAGRMRASWYLLSGEQFGAEEGCDMGLVTRVVDDAEVDGAVAIMCGQLAELPVNAVAMTKRLIKARTADVVAGAIQDELRAFEAALRSDEARMAFMKFMQRG
jgi:enoyl-CoA hydratase/carnithine racemase